MSDTSPSESAPAADSLSAAPPSAESTPPADSAGDDPFVELPDEPLFPRGYVEKLRNEGARYRTAAKSANEELSTYRDVYGVYPEEDRQVWFNIARTWATDPVRAAEAMQYIANSVLEEGKTTDTTPTPEPVEEGTDGGGQLTPEAVQDMINQAMATQAQSAAETAAIENIYSEVRSHGYDPESREGFMVLWTANNETDGDISAAVEKMKQYRQGIIDDYVAGRSSGNHPTPAPNGGVAASQQVEIDSWDSARKATEAFLRGQRGASA